jgi:hypothetical protein
MCIRYTYHRGVKKHPDEKIIDALGGTYAVAAMCKVRPPSVSEWKLKGIPSARRQFLELLRPDVFGEALESCNAT